MKLYAATGACALHVQIVLRELGLPFELELVDLATKRTASGADFTRINPKGYIPALVLDDGRVLTEGAVISAFLVDYAGKAGPGGLLPALGDFQRVRAQEAMHFIATEIHKGFAPLFKPSSDEAKATARAEIAHRYDTLEAALSRQAFLAGDAFSIVDAYAFNVVGWSRHAGIDLARWPALAAWHARVATRPTVRASMEAEGLVQRAA